MRTLRALASVSFVVATLVHGTVIPLPGSTPQYGPAGMDSSPVVVQVFDEKGNAVPNAGLYWWLPAGIHGVDRDFYDGFYGLCWLEPYAIACRTSTDEHGIAHLGRYGPFQAGPAVMTVSAGIYGSVDVILGGNGAGPIRIDVVSGDHQVATIGGLLPSPITVRVAHPDGTPVGGQAVGLDTAAGNVSGTTGADGHAVLPRPPVGWTLGENSLSVVAYDARAQVRVTASIEFTVLNVDGSDVLHVQNLWWAGPAQNGWGMSVVQHGNRLFNVLFVYDDSGNPIWYAAARGDGNSVGGNYDVYSTRGTPFWAYDASQLTINFAGTLGLTFRGDNDASLEVYTTRPPTGTVDRKSIVPQDLTGDVAAPATGFADLWWGGPSQSGWGLAIHEQFGALVALWFTYDANGRPTWFVMPGGTWSDASTYVGPIYQTSGPRWFNSMYNPSALRITQVGQFTLHFDDLGHATFDYSALDHSGRLSLARQPF